jgi:SAM-dependent methyltransferase
MRIETMPATYLRAFLQDASTKPSAGAAAVYNEASDHYAVYADGDPTRLFAFEGMHAYADKCVWAVLDRKLTELRASGATTVTILDAGCGPGTWLRRLVTRAHALGFSRIAARGFDVAQAQVQRARLLSRNLSSLPGIDVSFDVADLTDRLPETDVSVDITLCLYSVLSHLPIARLSAVAAEMARVTSGHFITTVRSIGSMPTAFVDSMDNVWQLKQDNVNDRCEIEFYDGRRSTFGFHLFTASELRACFESHFEIEDLQGIDLFHSRFAPDPSWNPRHLLADRPCSDEFVRLEKTYARHPEFIDRATHLLLVARCGRLSRLVTRP